MDREKEIQEIATVDSVCAKAEAACKKCAKKCVHYYRAIDLYNAGYRKADEVRKETAKEIIQKTHDMYKKYGIGKLLLWANALAAEYGVEVKE